MNTLKEKSKVSFSNALKNIFSLVSFNGNYNISGTGNLSSILYPSDYDLIEKIIETKSYHKALEEITKTFQEKLKLIKQNKNIYLIDFKCGIDKFLFFDKFNNIELYNEYLERIYKEKLITKNEYNYLKKLKNEEEIKIETRKLYILRWTEDEIIKGYKNVSNNRKIYFVDSIMNNTVIKIDIIAHLSYAQFVDISEIYIFKVGNECNFEFTEKKIFQNVKQDGIMFLRNGNLYKALKRVFSLYKFEKETDKLKILVDLFNSNIGLIAKVKSDLDIYKTVLERVHSVSIDEIKFGLQQSKQNLGNVYQFNINEHLFVEINNINKTNDRKIMMKEIDKIIEKLNFIIQKYSRIWLNKHKSILNVLKN